MKHQKVVVNVWKMIFSSCSYLALAYAFWVLLKLIYACFWLPAHLKKQEEEEGAAAAAAGAQLEVGNPGSEGKVEEAAANHSDDESKKTV